MILKISQFGDLLVSRPAGREAALAALSYLIDASAAELSFDFDGVAVLAPSWIHEFVLTLQEKRPQLAITFLPSSNPSVEQSLKFI